jgi:hypothetical protein
VYGEPSFPVHQPVFTNSTFTQNIAAEVIGGGAIQIGLQLQGDFTISNCIFWDNTHPQIVSFKSVFTIIRNSLVQGGLPSAVTDGGGNIDSDPLFVNGYELDAGSPAIDAGDNTQPELADVLTDLGGDPRFADDLGTDDTGIGMAPVIDMGAYEFQGTTAQCVADFTGDGELDFFDVSVFLQLFGSQDPDADFTGDGEWDFFDISVFLQAFGAGCP